MKTSVIFTFLLYLLPTSAVVSQTFISLDDPQVRIIELEAEKRIVQKNQLVDSLHKYSFVHVIYLDSICSDSLCVLDTTMLSKQKLSICKTLRKNLSRIVTAVFKNNELVGFANLKSKFKINENLTYQYFLGPILKYANSNNICSVYSYCNSKYHNLYFNFIHIHNTFEIAIYTRKNSFCIDSHINILKQHSDLILEYLLWYAPPM